MPSPAWFDTHSAALGLGTPAVPGITFNAQVDDPALPGGATISGSKWAYLQKLNATDSISFGKTSWHNPYPGVWALDGGFPAPAYTGFMGARSTGPSADNGYGLDSPNFKGIDFLNDRLLQAGLHALNWRAIYSINYSDSFSTYIMYKPGGNPYNHWVPLRVVSWSYSISATNAHLGQKNPGPNVKVKWRVTSLSAEVGGQQPGPAGVPFVKWWEQPQWTVEFPPSSVGFVT
jgi:hypothetical protein